MPTMSRVRLLVLLFFLPAVVAAVWGVRSYHASQVSANTQALIKAVLANDNAAVAYLLDHGADPNFRDNSGNTPLGNAVLWNRTAIVSDLLAHGANVNKRTDGETVLFWAATGSSANVTLVHQLICYGADVNAQEDSFHQTVLMRAADDLPGGNQVAIVQTILAAHPFLDLRDMGGDTAWRIAAKVGNGEITALLKQAGAAEYSIFPTISVHHAAYSITDLGLGQANALNNYGDVVGQNFNGRKDSDGNLFGQAFFWREGQRHLLTPFHGPFSSANNVDDRGRVVGMGAWSNPGPYHDQWTEHAFVWQNGAFRDLYPNSGLWRSRQWLNRQTQDGSIWDSVEPVAMNNNGEMIFCLGSSGSEYGGVWNGRKLATLASPDKGPVTVDGHIFHSSLNNRAYGINDNGVVVGDDDDREALLWRHGRPSVLPGLYHHGEMGDEMRAEHINNHGQVVGTVSDDLSVKNSEQRAVLWQGGKVSDLNSLVAVASGWVLEDARCINGKGLIVGRGTYRGAEHAFLLTPLTGSKRVY